MKRIILLSTSYWDSPLKFRRHKLAEIASKRDIQTIYVNPIFTILSFIQDEDCRKCFWDFFKPPKKVNDNLRIITMPPLLPFQKKYLWIRKINFAISSFILKIYIRPQIDDQFICYSPEDVYRTPKNTKPVYEIVDEHKEYPWNLKYKNEIEEMELSLIKKCKWISTTSKHLYGIKKRYTENIILTPNGVDYNLFSQPKGEISEKDLPENYILYTGALMEWFDYDLVNSIADENKNWTIVLIGPKNSAYSLDKPNIIHLGTKKQTDLPKYISKAKVCIIPFLTNDLIKGVNPLKLYEYLAAGRPVVSTMLPDVAALAEQDCIHVAQDKESFIREIKYFMTKNPDESIDRRREIAYGFSWDNIYKNFLEKLND